MTEISRTVAACALLAALAAGATAPAQAANPPSSTSMADYIVAVVNEDLVTRNEVDERIARIRADAARNNETLPPDADLRRQVLEMLINERVIITHARATGVRVDPAELERAVANVAANNKLTVPQLRDRLQQEGLSYERFRNDLRDQILVQRVREREVMGRVRVTDGEVDRYIAREMGAGSGGQSLNIAQILIEVPESADAATVAAKRALAEEALQRVKGGATFADVAREVSADGNRERGGEIGLKPADRLPDLFVNAVRNLPVGGMTPEPLRSGAGFHILKLLDRQDAMPTVTETHARHILLRTSPELSRQAAMARMGEIRSQIESGAVTFEAAARQWSDDGSAANGGDLGWLPVGSVVPEFAQAMNQLPAGGISQPVVSRFGVHLVQVLERREAPVDKQQLRDQARNALREQKFPAAYDEWLSELRAQAYVEMREPPQ